MIWEGGGKVVPPLERIAGGDPPNFLTNPPKQVPLVKFPTKIRLPTLHTPPYAKRWDGAGAGRSPLGLNPIKSTGTYEVDLVVTLASTPCSRGKRLYIHRSLKDILKKFNSPFLCRFKLNWIMWVAYFISAYFFYRHWIKKSSFAGKLTQDNSSSSRSGIAKPNDAVRRRITCS